MERGKKMARKFRVVVNGKEYIVEVEELGQNAIAQVVQQAVQPQSVSQSTATPQQPRILERSEEGNEEKRSSVQTSQSSKPQANAVVSKRANEVRSPMAGIILKVVVSEGQKISRGQKLIVFEAMKMENEIVSEYEGTVTKIYVKEGDNVETNQLLMVIE